MDPSIISRLGTERGHQTRMRSREDGDAGSEGESYRSHLPQYMRDAPSNTTTGLILWYSSLISRSKNIRTCGRFGKIRPVSGSRQALDTCVSHIDASMARVWPDRVSMDRRWPAGRRRRQRFLTPMMAKGYVCCMLTARCRRSDLACVKDMRYVLSELGKIWHLVQITRSVAAAAEDHERQSSMWHRS